MSSKAAIATSNSFKEYTLKMDSALNQPGKCIIGTANNPLMETSGNASTGRSGHQTWRLTDYTCLGGPYDIKAPIIFVATPDSDAPVYLTISKRLEHSPDDIVVEVHSWDKKGNPAPNVSFSWYCRYLFTPGVL